MHLLLEVPLSREGRRHEHVEGHRLGQLHGSLGDVASPPKLEPMLESLGVGAEGHDVEVLSANRRLAPLPLYGGLRLGGVVGLLALELELGHVSAVLKRTALPTLSTESVRSGGVDAEQARR